MRPAASSIEYGEVPVPGLTSICPRTSRLVAQSPRCPVDQPFQPCRAPQKAYNVRSAVKRCSTRQYYAYTLHAGCFNASPYPSLSPDCIYV